MAAGLALVSLAGAASASCLKFDPARTLPTAAAALGVAVADLNGDGAPDIATTLASGQVAVFLAIDPGVSYAPARLFATGPTPRGIAAADLDGDGFQDLATANAGADSATILFGDGAGDFPRAQVLSLGGGQARDLVVGDIDGSGLPDVAIADQAANRIGIFYDPGSGVTAPQFLGSCGGNTESIAIGDLDGDGRLDLAVSANWGGCMRAYFNDGARSFSGVSVAAGSSPSGACIADWNGDGNDDLATGHFAVPSQAWTFLGGRGGYSLAGVAAESCGASLRIAGGDLCCRGVLDLITGEHACDVVDVFAGRGDAAFDPAESFPIAPSIHQVVVGDLDLDGAPDVVVASGDPSVGVAFLLNRSESCPRTREVAVDIHPGSCPNPLNPRGRGLIPVAVLGGATFDAAGLDAGSVRLEGVAPLRWSMADVSAPLLPPPSDCTCWAGAADGLVDLVLHFDIEAVVAALESRLPGPWPPGEPIRLHLTGRMRAEAGGGDVHGSDCMVVVGPR